MKEKGKTYIGKSKDTPRGGVTVIENTKKDGEDIEGDVRFKSGSYEPADELIAKGVAKSLSRRGKDNTIIFHDYDD